MPDYSVGSPSIGPQDPGTDVDQMYSSIPQPSIPQPTGLSQMPDPSGQSRTSQQAAVGQLMAMNQPGTPVRHPSANQ